MIVQEPAFWPGLGCPLQLRAIAAGPCEGESVIDAAEIASGLRALGLNSESVVVIHSSLRSFGTVAGGAAAVAEALISECGTVVAPSGTWNLAGLPAPPGLERSNNAVLAAETWDDFDAAVKRAVPFADNLRIDRELGAVPEALRLGYANVRGRHPLFSFLAIGTHASRVIGAERLDWPLGPLEAVADLDGEVLLLGVGHTVNTTIHLAEQRLGRSCFYRYAKLAAGVWAELPNVPGESHRFEGLEPAIRTSTREVSIGPCRARVVKVRAILRVATEAIQHDPSALLCDDDYCRCGAARRQREAILAR